MKKTALFLLALLLLSSCTPKEEKFKSTLPEQVPVLEAPSPGAEEQEERVLIPPKDISWKIPFYPQAPEGDWSLPWQETCEEASIVLAHYGMTKTPLSLELFKSELLRLVEWQKERFGAYEHTNMEQTKLMAEEALGAKNVFIFENPSLTDLKKELEKGNLIVAPFAGRKLKNPFYSGEGPMYHVLLIKGFQGNKFITHDVGTRHGENFMYAEEVVMDALHDWTPDILTGKKKVLIFRP